MDRMTDNDVNTTPGTTEVHAEVTLEPSKGQGMSGKYDTGGDSGGVKDRAGEAAGQAKERAGEMAGQAKERATEMAGQARERATKMAGQARERAGQMMDQAQTRLQDSGLMEKIEQNPLAALGIAFGVGFLLAGGTEGNKSTVGKAKHQLKGAIMGGLSAAIAQEARNLAGMQGGEGGLGSLLGSLTGQQQGGQGGGSQRTGSQGASSQGPGWSA